MTLGCLRRPSGHVVAAGLFASRPALPRATHAWGRVVLERLQFIRVPMTKR